MGIGTSKLQGLKRTSSSSPRRQSDQITEIMKKIDEKECTFIEMQAEIEKSIMDYNRPAMLALSSEIAAHIVDLNQLKHANVPSNERGRSQKVIYNFEISLAKLKSIINSDTVGMKTIQSIVPALERSEFFVNTVEPDIVSDLIHLGSDSRRTSFSNQNSIPASSLGSDQQSLPYENLPYQLLRFEDVFKSVQSEFSVLKDQTYRPINDVSELCQIDKGAFFLQVRLRNTDTAQCSKLNEKKFKLLKELEDFRDNLNCKFGEVEKQRDVIQEVNTLEILVDSANNKELDELKLRALQCQDNIKKTFWSGEVKVELLKRISSILERIELLVNSSAEHVYNNLEMLDKEELETIESIDRVLEDQAEYEEADDEGIYGNMEVVRQNLDQANVIPRVQRTISDVLQRESVYANEDIVKQNSSNGVGASAAAVTNFRKTQEELIHKRPLPLPRNYDDRVVNDLPKLWQMLNNISDREYFSETDKLEVAEIQKHAVIAKNLFERKIKNIFEKFEESVEL